MAAKLTGIWHAHNAFFPSHPLPPPPNSIPLKTKPSSITVVVSRVQDTKFGYFTPHAHLKAEYL